MIYNNQLVYKVVIWAFFGISLWNEKVALMYPLYGISSPYTNGYAGWAGGGGGDLQKGM